MAKEVAILVSCDLCGKPRGQDTAVTEDVPIRSGKQERELDLCADCKGTLDEIMAPYLKAGRKPGALTPAVPARPRQKATGEARPCPECETAGEPRSFDSPQGLGAHRRKVHGVVGVHAVKSTPPRKTTRTRKVA